MCTIRSDANTWPLIVVHFKARLESGMSFSVLIRTPPWFQPLMDSGLLTIIMILWKKSNFESLLFQNELCQGLGCRVPPPDCNLHSLLDRITPERSPAVVGPGADPNGLSIHAMLLHDLISLKKSWLIWKFMTKNFQASLLYYKIKTKTTRTPDPPPFIPFKPVFRSRSSYN